ncbi:putative inactive receptor kinase [Forsythia ovata]|uniref:Inactive receptor kinase n=1 Tax=Forsythia ovata TaxID=205694 RepID=A0ABD1XAF8_9LAMI
MHLGSLAFVLHGNVGANKSPLTWEVRCSIAYRVARAIEYLHSQHVCHGNIRSSNVFLTSSFDAYLSEHAIAQLFSPDAKPKPNLVAGYCPPEVTNAHEVSHKSDVYSFGVLLFELITGKAPIDALDNKKNDTDLPKWVRSMFQEKPLIDVFDNALHSYYNTTGIGEQMVQLLQLALCCTFQYPNKRPLMAAVTSQIRETCSFEL